MITNNENYFMNKRVSDLDLGFKKLLKLDYIAYYDEEKPNETDIKLYLEGKKEISLKTSFFFFKV